MCRTLLLLSLSAALLSGCKEFPDDLPPPSDSAPGKILLLDSLTPPDAQTGWWPDIGADSKDHVHVIYCDVYHGDLVYAYRNTKGAWSKERVDVAGAVGKYASMAVAPTGEIHVAYYDQTQNISATCETKSRRQLDKVQYRLGSRSGNGKRDGSRLKGNTPHLLL